MQADGSQMVIFPRSYSEWRECITVRCGILFTPTFIAERLHSLMNPEEPKTREFVDKYGERATPLFAVDQKSRVEVFTTDNTFVPKAGWVVLALVDPEREDARRAPAKAVSR